MRMRGLREKGRRGVRRTNKTISEDEEQAATDELGTGCAERKSDKNPALISLGSLLVGNSLLLVHSADNGDKEILAIIKGSLDLLAKVTLGDLDIVLSSTIGVHEVKETVINVDELVLITLDIGNVHVMGGGTDIFQLLAGEDIDSDKVDLGVTVLASLGGRHINDLARATLDDNVTVLSEGRALHREGQGGTRGGRLKGLIVALVVGHFL